MKPKGHRVRLFSPRHPISAILAPRPTVTTILSIHHECLCHHHVDRTSIIGLYPLFLLSFNILWFTSRSLSTTLAFSCLFYILVVLLCSVYTVRREEYCTADVPLLPSKCNRRLVSMSQYYSLQKINENLSFYF